MLAGIIQEKENHYYIYIEEEKDKNTISVIHTNKDKTKCLTEEEAKELLKIILSSALTYHEKQGEYDVYLDESDNKRYFKNGKENYNLFFENNGISAIEYNNPSNKLERIAKRFIINVAPMIFSFTLGTNMGKLIDMPIHYKVLDSIPTEEITVDRMFELIDESPNITDEEKDFLKNKEVLEEVKRISENNRNYSLSIKLSDIATKRYNNKSDEEGYYCALFPSNLYIHEKIKDEELYYVVCGHEYIHLLQNNCHYFYITEAVAELMNHEYLQQPIVAYTEQIKRVKVLMEIIGPKAVLECCFSNSTESFENKIKEYLDEKDAKKLLKLFKTHAKNFYLETDIEIDEYLAKMYNKKTGNDMYKNQMIREIYTNLAVDRFYFNNNSDYYSKDYKIEKNVVNIEKIEIEQYAKSENVKYIFYIKKTTCSKEDLLKIMDEENAEKNSFIKITNDEITFTDDGHYKYKEKEFKSIDELIENGFAKKVYYYKTTQIIQTPEELNEIKPNIGDVLKIEYNNGTETTTYCETEHKWKPIIRDSVKRKTITYPSIPTLFPEDVPTKEEEQYSSKLEESSELYTGKTL